MPEALIEHLRAVADEGRREAPPGREEHFARRAVTRAYLEIREVQGDLERIGLPTTFS